MATTFLRVRARGAVQCVAALRFVRRVLQPLPVALLAIIARGRLGHVRAAAERQQVDLEVVDPLFKVHHDDQVIDSLATNEYD